MAERAKLKRKYEKPRNPLGKNKGTINLTTKKNIDEAIRRGKLPNWLLFDWAYTGIMEYPNLKDEHGNPKVVVLDPDQRIAAAGKASPYYAARLTAVAVHSAQPEQLTHEAAHELFCRQIEQIARRREEEEREARLTIDLKANGAVHH